MSSLHEFPMTPNLDTDEGSFVMPSPGFSAPLLRAERPHVLALRGELPADSCAACGQPIALHYDTTGNASIGCVGVLARKRLAQRTPQSLHNLTVFGDIHPEVSEAVRDVLFAACGPRVSMFWDELSVEEQWNISRRMAQIVVPVVRKVDALAGIGK